MTPFYFLYNMLGFAAGPALMLSIWARHRRNPEELNRLYQRLGGYPQKIRAGFQGRPRVWLHAVSVGEVGVAAAIAAALRAQQPLCRIAVSTNTRQGLARAKAGFGDQVPCFYAPIDMLAPTDRALAMARPDILALLETEIWPNLIIRAQRMGIRIVLLNGRISVRAIRGYLHIRPLMRHVLSHIDTFSMISEADAARIHSLGADEKRIIVNGNAKFDGPDPLANGQRTIQWARQTFGLKNDMPVFVAGSTREPEEQAVLDAYLRMRRSFPAAILIIAPRHTVRIAQIEQWVKDKGLQCQRRSLLGRDGAQRTAPVVLLDTIGELPDTYSIADFVFCGGSLVAKGGQNLLEPAAWAKPVMYGPSMEDFADARQLIEAAGGGVTVADSDQMATVAEKWLRHPDAAQSAGRKARQAILSHRGAAQKHAAVIARYLK